MSSDTTSPCDSKTTSMRFDSMPACSSGRPSGRLLLPAHGVLVWSLLTAPATSMGARWRVTRRGLLVMPEGGVGPHRPRSLLVDRASRGIRDCRSHDYASSGNSSQDAPPHCRLRADRRRASGIYQVLALRRSDAMLAAGHPQQARQSWQEALEIYQALHLPDTDQLRSRLANLPPHTATPAHDHDDNQRPTTAVRSRHRQS